MPSALRLEPYLEASARAHPQHAAALRDLVAITAPKRVLVHGDVSPKNILVGPSGPVFLMPNALGTATRRSISRSA